MGNLFFGFEVQAPWPKEFPKGRIIEEKERHLTLLFLGKREKPKVDFCPDFEIGAVGEFDFPLFLPEKHPHLIAWHMKFWQEEAISNLQKRLSEMHGEEKKPFLPHMTICRGDFVKKEWEKAFLPIPFLIKALHLYESLGFSKYNSLWSYSFVEPFEAIEHTADIAFKVRGTDFNELQLNAKSALAFEEPKVLNFSMGKANSLDEVIMNLNFLVTKMDEEVGAPFKAVSFHDKVIQREKYLEWEMIVDV